MTPSEHYAEAEGLLALAVGDDPLIAVAQVHATLATVSRDVSRAAETGSRCSCPKVGPHTGFPVSRDPDCEVHGDAARENRKAMDAIFSKGPEPKRSTS